MPAYYFFENAFETAFVVAALAMIAGYVAVKVFAFLEATFVVPDTAKAARSEAATRYAIAGAVAAH
ncbi:hypothetical protein [Propionivibrio limicola]|uniref:hypothetical protein n=1 Tax=Propionivibrio limicola TaxID=167645 RepID=UPI001291A612|nr:hypothetical protein [Propionivibrio limicola]